MLLSFQQGKFPAAVLVLADNTVFKGYAIGAQGATVGEVVFNTSMTGYQEILTDPSYSRQIVTLTYPHIGNCGINDEDIESEPLCSKASGLVIRDLPLLESNFRSKSSLQDYLKERGVVAIGGLDTRKLTRHLREHGTQNGCIIALPEGAEVTDAVIEKAHQLAIEAPSMKGLDLAQTVTTKQAYSWKQSTWDLAKGYGEQTEGQFHVVVYDYGVKLNMLRLLAARDCRVTVVPAKTPFSEVQKLQPDGILLSNGPGDPAACDYAIESTKQAIDAGIPIFGICLGHQIMALAMGGKTYKMKFGHHGANHPVKDLDSGCVSITSQNHGFAVDPQFLPKEIRVTHISLFDGSVQGLEHVSQPAFCIQGHPEASGGPLDITPMFDRFIQLMQNNQRKPV